MLSFCGRWISIMIWYRETGLWILQSKNKNGRVSLFVSACWHGFRIWTVRAGGGCVELLVRGEVIHQVMSLRRQGKRNIQTSDTIAREKKHNLYLRSLKITRLLSMHIYADIVFACRDGACPLMISPPSPQYFAQTRKIVLEKCSMHKFRANHR